MVIVFSSCQTGVARVVPPLAPVKSNNLFFYFFRVKAVHVTQRAKL